MSAEPLILVFDSGLGGLTVHAKLKALLPGARYVYIADDAAFPYGRLAPDVLIERVSTVIGEGIRRFVPDLIIIACNTASTICLPALRAAYSVPFVGTVPAVKPAAALSRSKMISILGTPGTVSREYTHDLIIQHAADCRISLVGAPDLAKLAEAFLRGEAVSDDAVLAEILPCFKEKDGARTDAIALACTHYPLLLDVYKRVAPWEVAWVDPAPAIARRAASLLQRHAADHDPGLGVMEGSAFFTSGAPISIHLTKALSQRGLVVDLPFALPF
jgi:glutamate racemase